MCPQIHPSPIGRRFWQIHNPKDDATYAADREMDEPADTSEEHERKKPATICDGLPEAELQPNSYTDDEEKTGECPTALTPNRVVCMQGEC